MKLRNIALSVCFVWGFGVLSQLQAQSLDPDAVMRGDTVTVNPQVSVGSEKRSTAKRVRNYVKEGNKLFHDQRFAEAEVLYGKALELNPNSEEAQFNLACALLKNSGNTDPQAPDNPMNRALQLLQNLTNSSSNRSIVEKSFYNMGNVAFNQQQYQQSIDMYKNVLRRNPDNDKARQNLRLAQLKLQNQDQNQDQDQQDQEQQDKQDQEQQQQNQQDQQNQNQNEKKDQQQQQQPQMSDANAERILKAMENAEAATRKKVEAQKAKEQNTNTYTTDKPW